MKKLSIFILFCIFFLTGCTQEKKNENLLEKIKLRDKIIVGIKSDSKPFGYINNNEISGFDADIAKNIAQGIFASDFKGHIEFVPLKAQERIIALNAGRVDMIIATLSINERRKEIIDFSIPYFIAGQALMVPYTSRIKSIEQLNNKPVAVVLGTTGERTVRLLAPNVISIGATSYKDAFDLLKNGSVEAILADDSLLYGIMSDNKGYKILPQRYTKEFYAIGLRQGEENASLKRQLNAIIKDLQETGKLNRIKEKWIPSIKISMTPAAV
ncbi:MAG: transporter substrate-binding domain-containing protein [Candidatus Gastranaerophilales bacterium]|nr:transporter substrate-binding domain-containing protein [Candidatus Gastranaerophilales bacterium]